MIRIRLISLLRFLSISLAIVQSAGAFAQEITLGTQISIRSEILKEDRNLFISAPENATTALPLIIIFDGEVHFGPLVSAVRFMTEASEMPQMPEAVIVGVPNKDRMRDMPTPQRFGTSQDEFNFARFLKEELIPELKRRYKLNNHVIAIGHSQGGLFVTYLMAEHAETFSWIVAMDAPVGESFANLSAMKANVAKNVSDPHLNTRYASFETVHGWNGEWQKYLNGLSNAKQIRIENETHETMPYISIYEGLKFLFHDFAPVKKDANLSELKDHFERLSKAYGYRVEIPQRILLNAASRKFMENRRDEIVELLSYAEATYGTSDRISELKARAQKISNGPDPQMDIYRSLPRPTVEQVKPYLGTWVGETIVSGGQNMPTTFIIAVTDNKPTLKTYDFRKQLVDPDVFAVNEKGELVVGMNNRGGGIFISTLTRKGNELSGPRKIVGFVVPDSWPEEMKQRVRMQIANGGNDSIVLRKQ